jgi:hypothetical protein
MQTGPTRLHVILEHPMKPVTLFTNFLRAPRALMTVPWFGQVTLPMLIAGAVAMVVGALGGALLFGDLGNLLGVVVAPIAVLSVSRFSVAGRPWLDVAYDAGRYLLTRLIHPDEAVFRPTTTTSASTGVVLDSDRAVVAVVE